MKKIVLLSAITLFIISCSKNENNDKIETIIASKDVKAIEEKRNELKAQLVQLEEALKGKDVKKEVALVSVLKISDTIFSHYIDIQGNVDTKQNILIQPEMPGTLLSLNVKAGQRVAKGQVLGRVDDSGMSQQIESLETQYQLAKTTFERQKNLWNQKIGSEIQFLQAQTQMVSLQKSVAQVKEQLKKTIIRAPFSGTIDEVFVERGQVVSASPQGLMRIVNLSNMFVSTSVPETYIGKLKIGTQVEVFLSALGKTYKGNVRQIGNFINPNNRSFGIEISVPNSENLLRPNQVAKLKIVDYVNNNALVVPTGVIQKDGQGNQYVYVADKIIGNTATSKKVMVETGKSSENVTEILSGLNTNDRIVTEGVNSISEGMKLNF